MFVCAHLQFCTSLSKKKRDQTNMSKVLENIVSLAHHTQENVRVSFEFIYPVMASYLTGSDVSVRHFCFGTIVVRTVPAEPSLYLDKHKGYQAALVSCTTSRAMKQVWDREGHSVTFGVIKKWQKMTQLKHAKGLQSVQIGHFRALGSQSLLKRKLFVNVACNPQRKASMCWTACSICDSFAPHDHQ